MLCACNHSRPIVALSLKVSAEKALEDATRVKAITFLGRITRLKKKAIVRFKLYSEMINVLFPIMAEVPEDEDEDDFDDDDEDAISNLPSVAACQAVGEEI